MDVAENFFISRGYGNTTIAAILERTGIAKGTFYHHFPSKEAVMDAIIERYTDQVRERSIAVSHRTDLTPEEKILGVILSAREQTGTQAELLEQLHRPENEIFHQRSQQRSFETMVPILTEITREGIDRGVFTTGYPQEAIEMILVYAGIAFDELADSSPEILARRIAAFIHHSELLLGAEPGSLGFLVDLLSGDD